MKKTQERAVVEVAVAPAAAVPAKVKATRKKSEGKARGKNKPEATWKQTRPPKPLFPPTPLDEMAGILLIVAGLLLAAAMVRPEAMGALAPFGHWLQSSLGSGGVALVGFVLVLGAEAFLPHQALGMASLAVGMTVLFSCLEVLAHLLDAQGGTLGAALAQPLTRTVGVPGAWMLMLAVSVVDLQWITRLSLRRPLLMPFFFLWRAARAVARGTSKRLFELKEAWAHSRQRPMEVAAQQTPQTKAAEKPTKAETVPESTAPKPAEKSEADLFPAYTVREPRVPPPHEEPKPAEEEAPAPPPSRKKSAKEQEIEEPEDVEIPGYEDEEAPDEAEFDEDEDDEEVEFDENDAVIGEAADEEEGPDPWDQHPLQVQQMSLPIPRVINYKLPPPDLLEAAGSTLGADSGADFSRLIVETLNSFGVATRIVNVEKGPTVTRYELQPARGVKVSKITSLNNDIALALAAQSIRIEAPIPGKSAIGIEVPNTRVDAVRLREILESTGFSNGSGLMLALGKDISGRSVVTDLLRMPHLLIAGATGSGKSVCLNTVIVSILYRATPQEVQMVMVDPKRVELSIFEGIPHLANTNANPQQRIVKDAKTGTLVLKQATEIMNQRFEILSQNRVRNIAEYNAKAAVPMPYLVIIVDELAQLMQISARSVEGYLQELAQMGRAAGIHLILATQRPSVDVLTGTIKSNFPARIAFAVSAQVDSRTILDRGGAEKLLGRGDMLFSPTDAELRRVQGALITLEETERVVDFWRKQEAPENLTPLSLEAKTTDDLLAQSGDSGEDEDLLKEALRVIKDTKLASASNLQRKLQIGYPRAARLVDELEERGFLGPANGSKPRKILFLEGAE